MNAIIEFLDAWAARFAGFALPMLLQSAVLIGLLFALDLALRKRACATIRYAVWMLMLAKLMLPPSLASPTAVAYWLPSETVETLFRVGSGGRGGLEKTTANTGYRADGTAPLATSLPELTWQAVILVVWLLLASGLGIWVIWRSRMVAGIIWQSVEAPEDVRSLQDSCRRQLGIRCVIPVRCAGIGSPAICGLLRPIILIPPGLAENLAGLEMRSVLMHELAHYKRGDLWVNHLQIVLQILYWYNPLLWLANASIRRAREQAADEMVLVEMGGEAQAYPAALLHVARLSLGPPVAALGLVGILEPERGLTQRIHHIINRPLPRTGRVGVRGLAAALLLALVALPMGFRSKAELVSQPTVPEDTNRMISGPSGLVVERMISNMHAKLNSQKEETQKAVQAGDSEGKPVPEKSTLLIHKIVLQHIGPANISDALIRTNVGSKEGERFSQAQLDEVVKSIYATGFFRVVRFRVTNTPAGVDLACVIQERPILTGIQIVGNKNMSRDALQKALSCKIGQPLDERKLFHDTQSIGDLYQEAGWQKVSVTLRRPVINEKAGKASVTIEIDERHLQRLEPTGVDQAVDEAIQQDIKERFGGSRTLFIKMLHANGQTYESYRNQQRESVTVKAKAGGY